MIGGDDADSQVQLLVANGDFDSSVGGSPFFGDVDFGQDFDASNDRRKHPAWGTFAFNADAINSIADSYSILEWFDMNIAGPQLNRFGNHQIDQANNGGGAVVNGFFVCRFAALGLGKVDGCVSEFLQHRVSRFTFDLTVILVNRAKNRLFGGQGGLDFAIEDKSQFFDGFQVKGVRDQDSQGSVFVAERQDHVLAGDRFGYQFDHFVCDSFFAEVDEGDFVEFGQRQSNFFRRRILLLDQHVSNINFGVFGDLLYFAQLIQADHALLEKQVGEFRDSSHLFVLNAADKGV